MNTVEYFRIEGATLTGRETVDELRALSSKQPREELTLAEALAVSIYLKDARPAYRDNHPAWIKARSMIGKCARDVIDRIEAAENEKGE